jgi:hypothetical protein
MMEGNISFPALRSWNPIDQIATIVAINGKVRVLCRITLDTMKVKFGASEEDPMRCLVEHKTSVQTAARMLIDSNQFEEDGSVLIKAKDLQ